MRRALVAQGLAVQAGLAAVLLLMAFLSRDDPRFLAAYLWSLVIPVSVTIGFWRANRRVEAATVDDAPKVERAEGKRALGVMGATLVVWVLGLAAIFFLL